MKYMVVWHEKDHKSYLGFKVCYNTYTDKDAALTAYEKLVRRHNRDEHDRIYAIYITEVLQEVTE